MIRISHLLSLAALAVLIPVAGAAGADQAVAVSVLDDNPQHTVIECRFGEFTQRTVRIDGQPFIEPVLAGEAVKPDRGAPALPDVSRSIIIPDEAKMAVRVVDSAFYELENVDVAPSRGCIPRSVNPADVPYTFGPEYQVNAFYPGPLATLREPYILRDHRGIVVTAHPFQYNPVTRVLRVYTAMTVEVTASGRDRVNVHTPRPRALSRAFHELYEAHFINYNLDGRYDPLDEEGDMLIICHDAWVSNVMPLADHKNSIGIATTVVEVGSIGNNSTAIKNYIQEVYDTTDLAFVLLVGDAAQVASPSVGGSASDPSYAKLAGGDDYPEIMVGRFSAESAGDVDTQVERTIEYENLPATEQDWFWRGMGIASNQGPGDDGEYDNEHEDNIRLLLLDYGYTEVDQIYDPYGTAQMVTDGLNAGRGIINYTGHGWQQGWGSTGFSNSHVNALQNDNMLPFITSVACNTGEFHTGTCFGEAWLRATHNGEPTGAVGFYGSTISQSWDPPMQMQDEFADLYTTEQYHCYGTLCFAGSCSMMDEYGSSGVNEFNHWTIFGDPSLCIVGTVAPPTGMKVNPGSGLSSEGPHGGPFTPASIMYTLVNYDPTPLDYTVSKTADWIDLDNTGGTIPVGGEVYVTVSISDAAEGMGNGFYEDVVEFVNTTNHDGDCTRDVTLEIGVPMPVHVFNMDSDPGWTMTGQWEFGHPMGLGGDSHGQPDPTSGATGDNVCGVNLYGDYSTNPGGPYWLTTGAIDCAELTKVELHFQRWLNSDYQPYVSAMIEATTDGVNWQQLWENGSEEIVENSWSEKVFDLSDIADNEPTLYLRWGYEIGSGAWAYSGWNVDDVAIWGVEPSEGCPEDLNGDGVVDTADLLTLLTNWGTDGDGDIDGNGVVETADLLALLAAWGECP